MEFDEVLRNVEKEINLPTSVGRAKQLEQRHLEVMVRNSRRNGQPARLIVRYVNGAPSEGLPSLDK